MGMKSLVAESRQIALAVNLIELGARLQVLEGETELSHERLSRLYKEVAGRSPPKGQLPFSTDWFLGWQPNLHASLFLNIQRYLDKTSELDSIETIIRAFRLYLEQVQACGIEPLLSITRAWRLCKFLDNRMLDLTPCSRCKGYFVTETHENAKRFICGLCEPPARAGTGSTVGGLQLH